MKRGGWLKRRKGLNPRSKTKRYATRPRETPYMRWVKTLPCELRDYSPCEGEIEAAHVGWTGRGLGAKCLDIETISLCHHHHHDDQHGVRGLFRKLGKLGRIDWYADRIKATQALWIATHGPLPKGEAVHRRLAA
jgi:hypothetical protein